MMTNNRYEINKIDNNMELIEELCSSNSDDFKYLNTPSFIIYQGEDAVIINNGANEFFVYVDRRDGMICFKHYNKRMNKNNKFKFHAHDRKFYDWVFCLKSLSHFHTPYSSRESEKYHNKNKER